MSIEVDPQVIPKMNNRAFGRELELEREPKKVDFAESAQGLCVRNSVDLWLLGQHWHLAMARRGGMRGKECCERVW